MEKKMTLIGVGKEIAVVVLGYFIAAFLVNMWFPIFQITKDKTTLLFIVGISMAVVGFSMNLVAALAMMKVFKEDRLVTTGFYAIFLDPMYVLQIFITLPGLLLLTNS